MRTDSFIGRVVMALGRNTPAFRPTPSLDPTSVARIRSTISRGTPVFISRPYDYRSIRQWGIKNGDPTLEIRRRTAVSKMLLPIYAIAGTFVAAGFILVIIAKLFSGLPSDLQC